MCATVNMLHIQHKNETFTAIDRYKKDTYIFLKKTLTGKLHRASQEKRNAAQQGSDSTPF